ncbi:MAG: lipocalin family protein, partial [Candidatus Cloacimonetes bacterium]|nr:lipocalin family protein [Candidatus Cloacimonadota bacterium]
NAEWRMQLLKPFWSPFLIVDLAEDYRYTAIGVPNRKFVWIMSRTPQMSESDYAGVIAKLQQEGYNTAKIVKMPQVW